MLKSMKAIKGDRVIWIVVILLSVLSLLAVYSSTGTLAYKFQHGNTEYYIIKHFIILVFGLLLMYLAHLVKYSYFSRLFQVALYIAVPLLIITLFFGENINEAKRALQIPLVNVSFQTADLAKLTLIIFLARGLTKRQGQFQTFKSELKPLFLPIIIVCGLILPSDFSTAAMLFVTSLVVLFVGRIKILHILSFVGICAALFIMFIGVIKLLPEQNQGRVGTWQARIESFISGEEGSDNFQREQAKIAIANGGLFGKGPGNSTQRNFLPHPYSDFIYAIILEEYGLAGGSIVVLLYLILFFRAVRIVIRIPKNFGAFLVIGVSFSLVFQAMINMGVAVGLLPVTGQPLPLVSMGGTSIWFTSLAVGIILSVSKEVDKEDLSENEEEHNYATATL